MSVPIPNHIKHLSTVENQNKTWTQFSLNCSCGCRDFFVFQNYLNKEEKSLEDPYYKALELLYGNKRPRGSTVEFIKDDDGTLHRWILYEPELGWEGRCEEIFVPPLPYFSLITVIKIKCTECDKEHIVFDSRSHGYDGMTSEHNKEALEYKPNFRLKCKTPVSISVKIENDESLEEFKKNTNLDFTEEQYSNSFSWIIIYKIDEKGKKTKIFDWETA